MARHLSPGGQALVASKRFYFGTGGSTQYFREAIAARRPAAAEVSGRLVCSDVAVIDTGKGNIREVLRVSWGKPGEEVEPGVAENAPEAAT